MLLLRKYCLMRLGFVSVLIVVAASASAQLQTDSVSSYCCQPVVQFQQLCAAPQSGIIWVHIHENETTVLPVARQVLDSLKQGCIVTWHHSGNRNVSFQLGDSVYSVDPNRIFTPEGVRATLEAQSRYDSAAADYVINLGKQFTRSYINHQKLVLAMHNNSDGGGLHIGSYAKGGIYENDAADVFINAKEDKDDFFYVTDSRFFDYLKMRGFNVMLQNNDAVTNDGSLSVYCGYLGIPYLNIEAQLGHHEEQKRMMLAVVDMITALELQ